MRKPLTLPLRSSTNAILGKVPGKPDRLDTATRMAMDADFGDQGGERDVRVDQEPMPMVDPLEELERVPREGK